MLVPSGTPSTTLRGRATATGSFSTVIRVRDSAGVTSERTFSIGVDADPTAQHWAILVGDLATDGDTEVLLTNVCGDQAFGLTPMNPSAPGTGDASLDPADAAFSPDLGRAAFIGDYMIDGTDELFLSTTADPTLRRRISGPMVTNGDVSSIFWSPDSTLIAYIADQNTDGVDELFVVDVSNPAMPEAIAPTPRAEWTGRETEACHRRRGLIQSRCRSRIARGDGSGKSRNCTDCGRAL